MLKVGFIVTGVIGLLVVLFFLLTYTSVLVESMVQENPEIWNGYFIQCVATAVFFLGTSLVLFLVRNKPNKSYDYSFVSGELRVAVVYNAASSKQIHTIKAENLLKMGKVGSASYEAIKADRNNREIFLTPNKSPCHDKSFFYFYVSEPLGKRIYVLECREQMLVHFMKYVKRGILEEDYQ
ncbi:MAG: hypothetical protein ACI4U2_06650 [Christensenellaceae bacterium]